MKISSRYFRNDLPWKEPLRPRLWGTIAWQLGQNVSWEDTVFLLLQTISLAEFQGKGQGKGSSPTQCVQPWGTFPHFSPCLTRAFCFNQTGLHIFSQIYSDLSRLRQNVSSATQNMLTSIFICQNLSPPGGPISRPISEARCSWRWRGCFLSNLAFPLHTVLLFCSHQPPWLYCILYRIIAGRFWILPGTGSWLSLQAPPSAPPVPSTALLKQRTPNWWWEHPSLKLHLCSSVLVLSMGWLSIREWYPKYLSAVAQALINMKQMPVGQTQHPPSCAILFSKMDTAHPHLPRGWWWSSEIMHLKVCCQVRSVTQM